MKLGDTIFWFVFVPILSFNLGFVVSRLLWWPRIRVNLDELNRLSAAARLRR